MADVYTQLAIDIDVNCDLIRSISAFTLMMSVCRCLAVSSLGPDSKRRWYDLSAPTRQLTHFLSHCWQDGRWEKACALMLYTTRTSIILGTSLVVLLVAFVQALQLLPLPIYSFQIAGEWSTNGISCLVCGCASWCVLLVVSPLLHFWERWFLDKACICQDDERLKQRGIQELGSVLEHSERMVLLLSPNYFQRGWCAFEVATFMAKRGIAAIDLVPLLRARLVLSTFAVSIFGITIFHTCTALGMVNRVAQIQPQPVIRGVPAYTFLVWLMPTGVVLGCVAQLLERYLREQQDIMQQVKDFRFSEAKFTEEVDRPFVAECIERLFGSAAAFELEVQTEVLQRVTQELGDDKLPLRFRAIVAGTLPWLWWGVDMACTDPLKYKLSDILIGTTLALALLPVWFVTLIPLHRCLLRLVSGQAQWVQAAGSTGLFVFAVLSSALLMAVTSQIIMFEAIPSKLFISAVWATLATTCYARCSCTPCSGQEYNALPASQTLVPTKDSAKTGVRAIKRVAL